MAIDPDSPDGKVFRRLTQELHNRRTGRYGSAKWSRDGLSTKIERPPLDTLHAYFRGDPPLRQDIHSAWKPYVRAFLRAGRLNIAQNTVVSTTNRMDLRDFRTAAANDEHGDQVARRFMRANEWEQMSRQVHDFALSMGDGYTLTQPSPTDGGMPVTTAEDPRQVITAHDPLTRAIVSGLKLYRDDWDAADFAYLARRLDDGTVKVQKLIKKGRTTLTDGPFRFNDGWELDGAEQDSPGDVMPFERFENRFGISEFEWHLDSLDRINDKIFNEWWITKIQAFRQRAVKNLPDTEEVIVDGKKTQQDIDYTDMFTAAPDEMWRVPEDVDFWESTPVDLAPIIQGVQKDLERYCGAVQQPLHTVAPDAANGSAEGAALLREEHGFKIKDRLGRFDRRWCSVASKMFAFMGDKERADVTQIESVWGPIVEYSLAQKSDAANKLRGILPTEAIWVDVLQYRPSDVPNLRTLKGRDVIFLQPGTPGGQQSPAAPPAAPPQGQ